MRRSHCRKNTHSFRRLAIDNQPLRVAPPPWVLTGEVLHEFGRGRAAQADGPRGRELVWRDAVDASAIDAGRQVPRSPKGLRRDPLRMLDHEAIEVQHIQRPVRSGVEIDGTEPWIA